MHFMKPQALLPLSNMKKIILFAITIYLLIAPITYHPDTKLVLYYPTLGREKVWNIYKYLNENVDSAPKFHYPPMNYLVAKAELPVVKIIGGENIDDWFGLGSNVAFLDKNIFLYNLATKLPILLLILISGFLIYKISKKYGFSENRSRLVALVWYLNPITIYSGVMMGQNDILAIMPFLWGLLYYFDNPILAFTLFGLGGSIKSFPLIWAIAVAGVYPTQNWFRKIFYAAIPLFIYFVTILPFLKYDYFVKDVLNSGLAMRMFEMTISLGIVLPVVPILLIIITLVAIKNKMGDSYLGLTILLVTINLAVLGFSNFNPQWFIWIMPFMSLILVKKNIWMALLLVIVSWIGILMLIDDKFLYWGILSPINSDLINLPYVSEILLKLGINIVFLNKFFHYMLFLVFLYWFRLCVIFKK